MPLVDARPPGLNAYFRPGNEFVLTLTWPAGTLTGRTFTAALDAEALTVDVVGDTMAVTATAVQTAAAERIAQFSLTETTGDDQVLIIGTWSSSESASESVAVDVTVTQDGGAVEVSFPGIPSAVGELTVASDITISGEILTGSLPDAPTFGGIEREAVCFPSGGMSSPTAVMNFGDGWPRLSMPDGVTTHAYQIIQIQEWWLVSTIGVYFEWVNDAGTTGNVRFDLEMREVDIATETLTQAGSICAVQRTASVAANTMMTTHVGSIATGNPITMDPGLFASTYVLRISRLGADAADTLAGPIGIVAASMTRGQ